MDDSAVDVVERSHGWDTVTEAEEICAVQERNMLTVKKIKSNNTNWQEITSYQQL